jgi:sodium-dependent dicarboxylate transporter 2/3/5
MANMDMALLWKRRWFIVTMLLGFALMSAPTPAGLTHDGQIVLVMSLMATLLFITEARAPAIGGTADCRGPGRAARA